MLTPAVAAISRARHAWLHPRKPQGLIVERPRPPRRARRQLSSASLGGGIEVFSALARLLDRRCAADAGTGRRTLAAAPGTERSRAQATGTAPAQALDRR